MKEHLPDQADYIGLESSALSIFENVLSVSPAPGYC